MVEHGMSGEASRTEMVVMSLGPRELGVYV